MDPNAAQNTGISNPSPAQNSAPSVENIITPPQENTPSPNVVTASSSKKPLILILVAIVLLAAAGAGGYIYFVNNQNSSPTQLKTETVNTNTNSTSSTPKLTLNVESPTDGTLIDSDQVTVKGTTLPNTTVVFYTETDENSVVSDTNGKFEGTLTLQSGINSLIITAFAENGEEQSVQLSLVYDPES